MPAEEAIGTNISDILDQEQYNLFTDSLENVLQNDIADSFQYSLEARKTVTYEEVLELPAGSRIWLTKLSPVIIMAIRPVMNILRLLLI